LKIKVKEERRHTIGQIRYCVDDFCDVAGENVVLDESISPTLPDNMPLSLLLRAILTSSQKLYK
jgi:hypothetical protein